jgi:hypothetical protein
MNILQTYEWEHYQMLVSYTPAGSSSHYTVLSDHTTFQDFLEYAYIRSERVPCNIKVMFLDDDSFNWYVEHGTSVIGEA